MTIPETFAPGFRLTDGDTLNDRIANPQWSTTSSATATPGGTMATSTKIVNAVTNVTVASVPGAGITLPQAFIGTVISIINNSPNDITVYAEGDSSLNGAPGSVGITLPKAITAIFIATDTREWVQINDVAAVAFIVAQLEIDVLQLQADVAQLQTDVLPIPQLVSDVAQLQADLPLIVIDTVDVDLPAKDPALGVNILVNGYYVNGDGGGGYYYPVTGAAPGTYVDNGGTIILPTGGNGSKAWLRVEESPFKPAWFGAKGDGVTDDTAAIQAAINALPVGGILDGEGALYQVTSCVMKSYMTLQNFRFFTKAGSVDFVSPVTIGNVTAGSNFTNINIFNVHVDGNRQNQTLIGGTEDGGRHGFRIIGHVENVVIDNCSAGYCASDGLCIFSSSAGVTSWPRFINIIVKNSRFYWNRRHGSSGDSMQTVRYENCEFNDNGQNLDPSAPLTDGRHGATIAGNLYGNGVDLETYGAGFQYDNVIFSGCNFLRNVRAGLLVFDPANPADPGFAPSTNITVHNCTLDKGTQPSEDLALTLTSAVLYESVAKFFENVYITDCNIQGLVGLRAVDGCTINGGTCTGYLTDWLVLVYSINIKIGYVLTGSLQVSLNGISSYQAPLVDNGYVWIGTQVTLTAGATYDTGKERTTTQGYMVVYSSGSSYPFGGAFAAQVYLAGGAGATIVDIANTAVVSTNTPDTLQIVDTATNWEFKNNYATTITLTYTLLL